MDAAVDDKTITFRTNGECPSASVRFTPYDRVYRETDQPLHDESLLSELASKMAEWPARWGKYRFDAIGIPAAYTYLGQLIAHDLTWNEATTTESSVRFQRASLDFKSIFERANDFSPAPSVRDDGGLALGCTSAGRQGDLPRSPCGASVLADTRNDQTLTLSQLVVLVTKFYQVFAARTADKTQAHLDARRHMQWIVLYDYLPRLIDPAVYGDVMQSQTWPLLGEGAGLIPIEFSAASFRLGHAMVRYRYPHWREGGGGASLKDLLRFTHHSAASRLVDVAGERRLPDDWTAGWSFLLPSEGEGTQTSLSASIDENLALDLFALPDSIGDCLASATEPEGKEHATFNLAEHTLVRGNRLCLDSAQSLSEFADARLKEAGGAKLPRRLPTMRLSQTRSHSLSDFLASDSATSLRTDTPLWFYFLREADIHASGQHFGPLASRITMETIFRAIRSDADGILQSNFKPDFSNEHGKFGLKDLHKVVQTHWKSET